MHEGLRASSKKNEIPREGLRASSKKYHVEIYCGQNSNLLLIFNIFKNHIHDDLNKLTIFYMKILKGQKICKTG